MRACLAGALLALLPAPLPAGAETVTRVDVARQDSNYTVEAVMVAPVPVAAAWAVMTDFDAMARFVPNLTESRVVARQGHRWTVEQKGVARFGPFRFRFESVRELDLVPTERVVSRQLKGAMRSASSVTTFAPAGDATRVTYRAQMEPGVWLPSFISERFIAHEVREHLQAIAGEMVRRHAPDEARLQEGK